VSCCNLNADGMHCDCDPCGTCGYGTPRPKVSPVRQALMWASALALSILLGGVLLTVISTLITHGAQR
jgi:hypothetical protein